MTEKDFYPTFDKRAGEWSKCEGCGMACGGGDWGTREHPRCYTCADKAFTGPRREFQMAEQAHRDAEAVVRFWEAVAAPDFTHVTVRRMAPLGPLNAHAYRRDEASPTNVMLSASASYDLVKDDPRFGRVPSYPGATYGLTRNF